MYTGNLHQGQPPIVLKHRFRKKYRHTTLDNGLTKSRVAMEARALMRCLRSGVSVPGIRMVDPVDGVLGLEYIDGPSVRTVLGGGADDDGDEVEEGSGGGESSYWDGYLEKNGLSQGKGQESSTCGINVYFHVLECIMTTIGTEIAKMHAVDVIHGDLTTSNMMLRRSPDSRSNEIVRNRVSRSPGRGFLGC